MVRNRTMEIAALSAMGVMAAGTASSAEKASTNVRHSGGDHCPGNAFTPA